MFAISSCWDISNIYDAWGELKWGNNPTPYGYKGQWGYYRDMETGLLLLTYRYLDPASGRFLTRDPIGVEGGVNLYAYVGNGVVVNADGSGLIHVVFDYDEDGCGTLKVYAEKGDVGAHGEKTYPGQLLLSCKACSGSKRGGKFKPIPPGDWDIGRPHWLPGKQGKRDPRFGPIFIPICTPGTGRSGIGFHGGDEDHAYPCGTRGCIRGDNNCMTRLGHILDRNAGHHNHITVEWR